jgi:enoyl-CoA hydratase/carnithine racemase
MARHHPSTNHPPELSWQIFKEGYELAYRWASMKQTLIPYFEGITVGGVVGWTANSRFRVATEQTMLAIPELRIGYFIDCGGADWIRRRANGIGELLAYTGYRLKGADVVHAGMADYFVRSDQM